MPEQRDFIGGGGKKIGYGHAGTPGCGPKDETCNTCDHVRRQSMTQKTYYKCGIGEISRGAATDIRLKDPACEYWEKRSD